MEEYLKTRHMLAFIVSESQELNSISINAGNLPCLLYLIILKLVKKYVY